MFGSPPLACLFVVLAVLLLLLICFNFNFNSINGLVLAGSWFMMRVCSILLTFQWFDFGWFMVHDACLLNSAHISADISAAVSVCISLALLFLRTFPHSLQI